MDLYLIFYNKFVEKADYNNRIGKKDLYFILGCVFHIPKVSRKKVIEEMVRKKMLRQLNRGSFELI